MDELKRVLVACDLTEMDETLVRYITRLSNEVDVEKIYFFNVMKSLEVPDKILEKYPDLIAPMDEATKREIQFTIDQESKGKLQTEYEIKVTDGHRAEKILKWAKIKEVDLIVMGKKSGLEGEGIISGKVLKLAPCSVIFIPELLPEAMHQLVVPIDFSKASKLAFEAAVFFAQQIPSLKISALNIYEVPTGYHYSGKSYDEFAEIMYHNAEESFKEFKSQFDLTGIELEAYYKLNDSGHVAKEIYRFAVKNGASAIVVGSKGRTQAAAVLVGSIAEKLIRLNSQLPLIVVKQRRHNMDFLEALLEV